MSQAFRGRLIGASFVHDVLPDLAIACAMPAAVVRRLDAWSHRREGSLGPASSVRAIADLAVVPLLDILGLAVAARHDSPTASRLQIATGATPVATALVLGWNEPLGRAWRGAVLDAIAGDSRWGFCCNGTALRLVDGRRTWSRDYLEFDLARLADDEEARNLLWTLARREALAGDAPLLDRLADLSAQHGSHVCRALGAGVLDALQLLVGALARRRDAHSPTALFEQSLTVLYRILFLHFAEARGLVPLWHPIYRDRYSLDAIVRALLAGRRARGLWQAIHAISRLAHAGCTAGELKVTAFNGRLFAPSQSPVFDRARLDDEVMGRTVMAVSTTAGVRRRHGHDGLMPPAGSPIRRRIVYRDLDVEQLGAVYEQVLEYEPSPEDDPATLTRTRDRRKASGTFYTPRAVTASLVQRTLEPLVRGRSADEILALRVLDPAMGSGAFLVAACRYLSAAVEDARIRDGRWHPGDVTPADRAAIRRDIAARCLFGVDLNPMAVQLARLSIWLATLAADKPLSFLDHHLVAGNSLVGAAPADLARPPGRGRGRPHPDGLPLFDDDLPVALGDAARLRLALTAQPDDSPDVVRAKERTLRALQRGDTALGRVRHALDLWCACWFWPDAAPPDRGTFQDLCDNLLRGRSALPDRIAAPLLARAAAAADRHGFLHWPLSFPEVFVADDGRPHDRAGFDAVIGNPPWDMVRGDSGDASRRRERQHDARQLTTFIRDSGIYIVDTRAHVNRYQLFLERALQLVRPGGRLGFVLPSGIATDTGAAGLRRHLFDRADVDAITGLDNRAGIFPIHRSVRFALLTCTAGRPTREIACRFGVSRLDDLDPPPAAASGAPLLLTRRFLARISGEDDLGIPELTTAIDLRILERISARAPWLGSASGWNVRFGRELNATDDREAFMPFTGEPDARPVVEGKQIEPFRVALDRCRQQLDPRAVLRTLVPRRARLAYRDVASATNRLTLIAAIVPARAVTTHTLFCVKNPLPLDDQRVLCALLNSFVANYLVRMRVNTHVTTALVSRLPVPRVPREAPLFRRLVALSEALAWGAEDLEALPEYVELQVVVSRLYGLSGEELDRVLETFPLIEGRVKAEVRARFGG